MSDLPLPQVNLDGVAEALTPDVIAPFAVPVRTIPLGPRESFWIREGYRARDPAGKEGAAAPATGDASVHITGNASVNLIAERLRHAVGADRVHMSIDALCAHATPDLLVRAFAESLGAHEVLVVATPVRAFTTVFDHPGPPENASRRREWTFPELQAFLDGVGLDVVFGGIAAQAAGESGGEMAVMIAVGRAPSRAGRTS